MQIRTRRSLLESLIPAAGLVLSPATQAQAAQESHPIDARLDEALRGDLSTADQLAAIADAERAWNRLMVETQDQLKGKLPESTASALRDSQQSWGAFLKKERTAITRLYENTEGTLFRPVEALDRMRLVRDRALQVQALLSAWELRSQ